MTDDLRKQLLVKGQGLSLKGMKRERNIRINEKRRREKKKVPLSLVSGALWNLKEKERK